MYTDGFVLFGYYNFADYLIKNGVTVYQYLFSYIGHFSNSHGKGVIAADHGDEVLYLWNYQDAPISGDDLTVKNIMTSGKRLFYANQANRANHANLLNLPFNQPWKCLFSKSLQREPTILREPPQNLF